MRRRITLGALFLLAGAVVNVAVAWACAAWVPVDMVGIPRSDDFAQLLTTIPTVQPGESWLPADDPSPLGFTGVGVYHEMRSAWTEQDRQRASVDGTDPMNLVVLVHSVRSGFPVMSLHGVRAMSNNLWWEQDMLVLPEWFPAAAVVPLQPIWPGFAVNTIFYAALLWLLILGPFALRRFIRVRRGLCPACTYPRSESDVCSECGKALPKRARVAT